MQIVIYGRLHFLFFLVGSIFIKGMLNRLPSDFQFGLDKLQQFQEISGWEEREVRGLLPHPCPSPSCLALVWAAGHSSHEAASLSQP